MRVMPVGAVAHAEITPASLEAARGIMEPLEQPLGEAFDVLQAGCRQFPNVCNDLWSIERAYEQTVEEIVAGAVQGVDDLAVSTLCAYGSDMPAYRVLQRSHHALFELRSARLAAIMQTLQPGAPVLSQGEFGYGSIAGFGSGRDVFAVRTEEVKDEQNNKLAFDRTQLYVALDDARQAYTSDIGSGFGLLSLQRIGPAKAQPIFPDVSFGAQRWAVGEKAIAEHLDQARPHARYTGALVLDAVGLSDQIPINQDPITVDKVTAQLTVYVSAVVRGLQVFADTSNGLPTSEVAQDKSFGWGFPLLDSKDLVGMARVIGLNPAELRQHAETVINDFSDLPLGSMADDYARQLHGKRIINCLAKLYD